LSYKFYFLSNFVVLTSKQEVKYEAEVT